MHSAYVDVFPVVTVSCKCLTSRLAAIVLSGSRLHRTASREVELAGTL